jgi:hypothetical protein
LSPDTPEWTFMDIERDLASFQQIVGGYAEGVTVCSAAELYCNEEGKLLELPPSALWVVDGKVHDTLMGTVFLTGPIDEDGYETSLTAEGFEGAKKYIMPIGIY